MTKQVTFRMDVHSEMLEVLIDGVLWREGNLWDFDFLQDTPSLLKKLDVKYTEEDYEYEEEE